MARNFARATVAVAPSPATSGLVLEVRDGEGDRLEAGQASLVPPGVLATPDNAEIVTVSDVAGDVVTMSARGSESTTPRAVTAGWRIEQGLTAAELDTRTRRHLVDELLVLLLFFVAHRGGADDGVSEHTPEAYRHALSRGVRAIEVSAQTTADGVPICLHDVGPTSLERTTTLTGDVAAKTLSQLQGDIVDSALVDSSNYKLGEGYTALHKIPLLGTELSLMAHRAVIFLEPKANPTAILAAIDTIPEPGKTIIWKFFRTGTATLPTHAQQAKARGLRTWIYLNDDDTDQVIADTAQVADALGIPLTAANDRIAACVATGLPVIVHPVRRRSEVARLTALGVTGIMCTAPSYCSTATARVSTLPLAAGIRLPGDYWGSESRQGTYQPATSSVLLGQGNNGSLLLGSMCPVPDPTGAGGGYRIRWEMKWATLPADLTTHSDLFLGHASDAPYLNQVTTNVDSGYHLFMRANGTLAIFEHLAGVSAGVSLGTASSAAAVADTWMSFEADVTATQIVLRRTDVDPDVTVTVNHSAWRGGYFGLAAATTSIAPQFRNISVVEL